MNILYTVFAFRTGGIEKLIIDILNNINQNNKNKLFLCVINDKVDDTLLKSINKDVTIYLLKRKEGTERFKYIIQYTRFVLSNRIDIIHCQAINGVEFSILAKLLKPNLRIFETINDKNSYLKDKKYEILIDNLFVDKIIAISDSVKHDILSRKIKTDKIEVIYNGIDINKYNIPNQKHNEINIGCVARIVPEKKGQDILIKAISIVKNKYPDIKCYFAGEPPEDKSEYLTYLKNIVQETKTDNNIFFMGNINDIPSFLSNIDIFVLPSRYEGFGISLIEAMAAGIPCIASNLDGPKEIIKDKYGLLFEPENYQDLASKILFCISHMKNYDKDEVQNYVKENYDINDMTKKLYNLYK